MEETHEIFTRMEDEERYFSHSRCPTRHMNRLEVGGVTAVYRGADLLVP